MRIIVLPRKKSLFVLLIFLILSAFFFGVYSAQYHRSAVAGVDEDVSLPIIMYHSILKDPLRTGDYVIPPDRLEADLAYLKEQGYTTIFISDLIAFVDQGVSLPEKPVMLTFDDGYYNNLVYLLPLLEKYKMKAVISVIGGLTDKFTDTPDPNPYYAHLTWDDIAVLEESGLVEVQNHSYALHTDAQRKGAAKMENETAAQYRQLFSEDVSALQYKLYQKLGIYPLAFTYPFGEISPESVEVLKELGFRAALLATNGSII